jgi:hypothetical protein
MTAMPVAQQMAADDYLTQPYDGRRAQLVEGEVVMNELTREDTLTSPLLPGFELPLSSLS